MIHKIQQTVRPTTTITTATTTSTAIIITTTILMVFVELSHCRIDDQTNTKYLNVKCDFERIPGGGCELRESICSLHRCVCKPDYPINIADRLCIARLKSVWESCTYSQECQAGSYCASNGVNHTNHCQCKSGHAYSARLRQCVRGLKGSTCRNDSECTGMNEFCSLYNCDCKVGYEWYSTDEICYQKSKYGEQCDAPINCKMHDEFSDCDPQSRRCVCGQFLSRRYILDELTRKCVSCPLERYHNDTNTCLPEKMTVEYSLLDRSSMERDSHQYMYILLSMSPFVVFGLIGYIYRYVNATTSLTDLNHRMFDPEQMLATLGTSTNLRMRPIFGQDDYCLQIDLDGNPVNRSTDTTIALICSPMITPHSQPLPDPPPLYEETSGSGPGHGSIWQDLPPSYEEAVNQ